jgi:hypothetical protein
MSDRKRRPVFHPGRTAVRFGVGRRVRLRLAAQVLDITLSEAVRIAVDEWLVRQGIGGPADPAYSRDGGSGPGA